MNTSWPARLVLISTLLFVVLRLLIGGGNFFRFVVLGENYVNRAILPEHALVETEHGYDGQFFYHYAVNPFSTNYDESGVQVDSPPYRQQRIAYPLLAWLLAFAQPGLVPITLVLINLLAFWGATWRIHQIASFLSLPTRTRWIGLLLPGLWMSLARDLSEVCEVFFLLSAIWAFLQKRSWPLATWLLLATFTRETSVILTLPLALSHIRSSLNASGSSHRLTSLASLLPFGLFAGYKYLLANLYGGYPSGGGLENFTWPFLGLWQGLLTNLGDIQSIKDVLEAAYWVAYIGWIGLLTALVLRSSFFRKKPTDLSNWQRTLLLSWFGWLLISLFFSYKIYEDDWSFMRLFSGFQALSLLLIAGQDKFIFKRVVWVGLLLVAVTWIRLILRP